MRRMISITECENGYAVHATMNLTQPEFAQFQMALQMGTAQLAPALGMYVARDIEEVAGMVAQLLRGQEPVPAVFRE